MFRDAGKEVCFLTELSVVGLKWYAGFHAKDGYPSSTIASQKTVKISRLVHFYRKDGLKSRILGLTEVIPLRFLLNLLTIIMLLHTLTDLGSLVRYWQQCRRARAALDCQTERVMYGAMRRQYFLRLTTAASQPDRLAFYFHGGGWTFGRPESFAAAAGPWLEAGFTVILPSYRRPPSVGMAGIVADCRAAIAAARPLKERVPEIHVGGISAGAQLAALLALRPEYWWAAGYESQPIKALLCSGPLSLQTVWPRAYFSRQKQFDPSNWLAASTSVDWLLLHGTEDGIVPFRHSEEFTELLNDRGANVRHLRLSGGHLAGGQWMFGGTGHQEVAHFIGAAAGAEQRT